MADSPIRVRQNLSLGATMGPTPDCPSAPQDFTNPLIGGLPSLGGDSPLSHGEMDANWRAVYPVGSIYINASDSRNPSEIIGFGGWESFGQGRVLVGHNNTGDSPRGHFNGDSPAVASTIKDIQKIGAYLNVEFLFDHEFAVGQFITLSGIAPHTVQSLDSQGRRWGNADGNINKEFQIVELGTSTGVAENRGVKLKVEDTFGPQGASGLTFELSKYDTPAAARFGGTAFNSPFIKNPAIDNETDGMYTNAYGYGGKISHKLTVKEMASHNHKFIGSGTSGRKQGRLRGDNNNSFFPTGAYSGSQFAYPLSTGNIRKSANTGESQWHTNIDKYITAYIWRRIA
jgi:hypothetical protein